MASCNRTTLHIAVTGGVGAAAWWFAGWATPLAGERFWCALPICWLAWHLLESDKYRRRRLGLMAAVAVAAALGLAWYMAAAIAYGLGRKVISREVVIMAYFLLAVVVFCQVVLAAADRSARRLWQMFRHLRRTVRGQSIGGTIKPQEQEARATGNFPAGDGMARVGLRLCRALFGLILILPILIEAIQLHPVRTAPSPAAEKLLREMAVPLKVITNDGLDLSVIFIPAEGGLAASTAIICHGVADSKEGMISFVRFVITKNYNAILFDMRGHGASGGHTTTFGIVEGSDVLAAYREARRRWPDAFETVVGCGWSMGAAALVYAQARSGLFDALWLDCPYAWTADMAWQIAGKFPAGLRQWLWLGGTALGSLEVGVNFFRAGPARFMPELPAVPTVIVHGTADEVIPFEQGIKLFELARPPKRFLRAEGAVHCGSWNVLQSRYEKALAKLLREAQGHTASRRANAREQNERGGDSLLLFRSTQRVSE